MLPLTLLFTLAQPDAAFARGVEVSNDAKTARPHFIEAAKGYDAEWEAGNRSAALATNRSRAHALAGDLPGAILAARSGLRTTPSDVELLRQLETLRNEVPYPTNTRPPRAAGWRTRLSGWDVFFAAAVGVLLVVVGVARRLTTRDGWAVVVASVGLVLLTSAGVAAWLLNREAAAEPNVLVLTRPTVLRKGNGDTYPPRLDGDLPRGAEVNERLRRGGWVQVELPGGVVGWVPEANTRGE
ncbi:MAG: hypothetical protein MUF18_00045 [Fimbriiglobus sp.]|jgi:hypothetical protein|nr:hypothetical protein [Fimbriiglobus sp.]